jgi:hypothetical protein|tara:strand:+ start:11506 stop:12651 length:1146 start_codon:yes stop_codon:yes gene_type:complete
MSEDVNNAEELSIDEQASEVSEEQLNDENQVIEDVVEDANEEVVESTEEELEEAKKKEDDLEEDAPKSVATPKTKAGVIQAAVDMLKSAKKEDAQKLFAKMAAISEDEIEESEDDGSVAKAIASAPSKKNELKAKAKVEALDFSDDLDTIIAEEATLSDGFKEKASTIVEAVLTSKLAETVERLESEYVQNLEEEVSEIQASMVEKVDSYLNYVVEGWMKDNEVSISQGLRTEIAEDFMTSLQSVFKEHYIEIPEGKENLLDELSDQVAELEESLNKTTEDNIELHTANQSHEKAAIVREASSGLAETDAEKFAKLVEDVEFDNKETFEQKVATIKGSFFKGEVTESVDEVNSMAGEDTAEVVALTDNMSRYTQAITKFNK